MEGEESERAKGYGWWWRDWGLQRVDEEETAGVGGCCGRKRRWKPPLWLFSLCDWLAGRPRRFVFQGGRRCRDGCVQSTDCLLGYI